MLMRIFAALVVSSSLMAIGCTSEEATSTPDTTPPATTPEAKPDATSDMKEKGKEEGDAKKDEADKPKEEAK